MSAEERGTGKIPLLVLAGPTAVGKSALALEIAARLETSIISADSAQVYRYLDIGTAKPTRTEQLKVKHHMIDLIDPDRLYSAAQYREAADQVIRKTLEQGKLPFMVGGTGLYIKAVTDRYAFGPRGSCPKLREALDKRAAVEGLDRLHAELRIVDPPASEKIHPHDRKRIIRALEVYHLEGRPISKQVEETGGTGTGYRTAFYCLHMDREELYKRIELRVEDMLEQGFLEEVRALLARGYGPRDPGMQVLGYRQLVSHLEGGLSYADAVREIKKETRNLAKRQLTWFRREQKACWVSSSGYLAIESLAETIYRAVQDL